MIMEIRLGTANIRITTTVRICSWYNSKPGPAKIIASSRWILPGINCTIGCEGLGSLDSKAMRFHMTTPPPPLKPMPRNVGISMGCPPGRRMSRKSQDATGCTQQYELLEYSILLVLRMNTE